MPARWIGDFLAAPKKLGTAHRVTCGPGPPHPPARGGGGGLLILEGPDLGDYPEPSSDARAVATAWLKSLRNGISDPAIRTAVLAVTAQADHDPESAQALVRIGEDRHAALNRLLEPSGVQRALTRGAGPGPKADRERWTRPVPPRRRG